MGSVGTAVLLKNLPDSCGPYAPLQLGILKGFSTSTQMGRNAGVFRLFFFVLFSEHRYVAGGILICGVVGLLWMLIYLRMVQHLGGIQVKIAGFQRRDAEAMAYIVTYIIPFLAIPFGGWKEGMALSIFFVVIGILYVNSDMIHINPMLNLFGYHLYEVTLEDGDVQSLITRHRIRYRETLTAVRLGDEILLEKTHGS